MARKVVWLVGSGAVCLNQNRTYQVGAASGMSLASSAKTWLQYVPTPSISSDFAPACACAPVTVAVLLPEQFGVLMLHRPEGALPTVWFSKPSQNTAALGQGPPPELPLGLAEALADGLAEALLDALVLGLALGVAGGRALALGGDEGRPAQASSLRAKSGGVA